MKAFVFPGQGSQNVGMGRDLYETFSEARAVMEAVDAILGYALSELMFEGPSDALKQTQNAQPALFTTSMMVMRILETEGDFQLAQQVAVTAGHSLGEYSALVAASTLDFAEAVELLRLRGRAMQEAVPPGEGTMAALLNLSQAQLQDMPQIPGEVCVIANDNADGQVVISGHKRAVENALAWAKNSGGRGTMLNVSGPFHSPLMASAQEVMSEVLEKVTFRQPIIPIITNMSGAPQTDPNILKQHLSEQLTGQVRWRETMQTLSHLNVQEVFEVGTGSVLSNLARRQIPGLVATPLSTTEDIELFLGRSERT